VVEGLARRNHSNRSRAKRDAGANSSKGKIPWKIRWGDGIFKPLLMNREGAFFIPRRGEVGAMDCESDMGEPEMGCFGKGQSASNIHPPSPGNRGKNSSPRGKKRSERK
jgi:hypothetical protein